MAENFFGITDTGKVRDNNEDAFIAEKVQDRFVIACAIDGVGGYSGGEIAAEIARESILDTFNEISGDLISKMKAAFVLANQKIFNEKLQTKEHSKMACVVTLAIVDIENNQFFYAHVGDTRLYLFRDSSLVKVSKDHSFVGFLEDSGRIDENAAMTHLKRNEINKALGFGREIETQDDYIDAGTSPFLPGDTLLLCSDGLTDMVNKEAISNVLVGKDSLEEKANRLIALANKNGGKDNITVVLVQNDSASSWQTPAVESVSEPAKRVNPASSTASAKPLDAKPSASTSQTKPANQPDMSAKKKAASSGFLAGVSGLTKGLGVLCVILFGAVLYLLSKDRQNSVPKKVSKSEAMETRNPQEMQLQDALSSVVNDTLFLSDSVYKQPIVLTDTLSIHQDTLVVIAQGKVILRRDSTLVGPAIDILPNARLVVLDGLQFENFDVAISVHNDALYLKNVQFSNCKKPIQNFFLFPDKKYVSGRLASASVFKSDSVNTPKK